MPNLIQAEKMKGKGTTIPFLLWIFPIAAFALAAVLLPPNFAQQSSYNWWYTLMLPALLTSTIAFSLDKDRKKNWHGMMGIVIDKKDLWTAKILYYSLLLLKTILVFLLVNILALWVFPQKISLAENIFASLILYIGILWQIPLIMFLTLRIGKIPALILNMVLNIILPAGFSATDKWMIPYSIPARLMIPAIDVLPNGLLNKGQGVLGSSSVILPGLAISILVFAGLSFMTMKYFQNVES